MTKQLHTRASILTAIIIRKLDKLNRIRHYQKLPAINYSPMEVERLCDVTGGFGNKLAIMQAVIDAVLNSKRG